jgi:hypothetical protein
MKSKVRLLNFVVSFTLILLTIGAMLVVLGIFNEGLHWDIFGPKLQAVLYGVFGSCMALAGFGVAMTAIIAIQESVKDFKRFVQSRTNQEEIRDAGRPAYLARMLAVVVIMGLLVGICALINHVVLVQRSNVFKRLTREQVANFDRKLSAHIETFAVPPTNNLPRDLHDLLKSLDHLEFVAGTTLYLPDPAESTVLWSFNVTPEAYTNTMGFARFYVARDYEKAMQRAFAGSPTELGRINSGNEFIWYATLPGGDKKPRAVMRIVGDGRQNFREYRLGQ